MRAHAELLNTPIKFPCGLTLPNRLTKAAMEESLASLGGGRPNLHHFRLYSRWGKAGWGMIITGNVQVSSRSLGTPNDICIYDDDLPNPPAQWKQWVEATRKESSIKTPLIMQICHTGRQCGRGVGRMPWAPAFAPSPVKLKTGPGLLNTIVSELIFGTPQELSTGEVKEVIQMFKRAALVAFMSGFDGIQLHCSHGYLLAQFMSPKTNLRDDEYGGTARKRVQIIFDIIDAIRDIVPPSFAIGVKLNSADYVEGGLTEHDALKNVEWIAQYGGVDFIEISGGTYENAVMLQDERPVGRRESFFAHFSHTARTRLIALSPSSKPLPLIMVTGGFRSQQGTAEAIENGDCDFVGFGRPACVQPELPDLFLQRGTTGMKNDGNEAVVCVKYSIKGSKFFAKYVPVKLVGVGVPTLWHVWQLQRMARGKEPSPHTSIHGAILESLGIHLLILVALIGLVIKYLH